MGKYAASAVLIFGALLAGPTYAGEPVSDARQTPLPPITAQTPAPQSHPAGSREAAADPILSSANKAAGQCGHAKPAMQPHAATSGDEYKGSPDWEVGEELC